MQTIRSIFLATAVLTLAGAPALAADTSADAQTFLQTAASGGKAEVALGELAQAQATNPEVKQFGSLMVTDHGKANAELQALASKKGVPLPAEVDAKHQQEHERLAKLNGADFDRAYMDAMVKGHDENIAAFEKAKGSDDPDVKTFASQTLPTLEQHQRLARKIHGELGSSAAASGRTGSSGATSTVGESAKPNTDTGIGAVDEPAAR